jgi:hypothetical protein
LALHHRDGDETLSWNAATIIMALATLFTATTRIFGTDPFTEVFDVFIVYLPTSVLVAVSALQKLRSKQQTVFSTSGQSAPVNTAA